MSPTNTTPSLPRLEETSKSRVSVLSEKSRESDKDGTPALSIFESPDRKLVPSGQRITHASRCYSLRLTCLRPASTCTKLWLRIQPRSNLRRGLGLMGTCSTDNCARRIAGSRSFLALIAVKQSTGVIMPSLWIEIELFRFSHPNIYECYASGL